MVTRCRQTCKARIKPRLVARVTQWLVVCVLGISGFYNIPHLLQPIQRECLVHLVALVLEWLQSYHDVLQQLGDEDTIGTGDGLEGVDYDRLVVPCEFWGGIN